MQDREYAAGIFTHRFGRNAVDLPNAFARVRKMRRTVRPQPKLVHHTGKLRSHLLQSAEHFVANVLCALSFRNVGTNRHKGGEGAARRTYRLKVDMRPVLASVARIVQEFDLTAASGVDRCAERRA